MTGRSRDAACASEFCQSHCTKPSAKRRRGRSAGRRTVLGAAPHDPMLPPDRVCGRGSASSGTRSPLGAPPRFLSRRPNALTQPRPRFTRAGGCRRYPHRQSRLSEAPRTPVRNAGGDDARTARERFARPRAGTALAVANRIASGMHPSRASWLVCNYIGDRSQQCGDAND